VAAGRIQDFFGDDLEDALDSLKSAPGAFGNIVAAAARQVRLVDALAFSFVVAGWLWLVFGYGVASDHRAGLVALALLPSVLWLAAGGAGGLIFEIGGIGVRSLAYWESYLLILLFAVFGVVSLRLALNPRDRRVYRAPASSAPDA
jgi:hypothetical protein